MECPEGHQECSGDFKERISLAVCLCLCMDNPTAALSHWELWLPLNPVSNPWQGFSMTLHHSQEQIPGVDQESAQVHPVLKAELDRMDMSKPRQVDEVPENGKDAV